MEQETKQMTVSLTEKAANKVKMLIATFASSVLEMRSAHDLQAFAQALGMTPKEAQDALHEAGRILMRNQEKKHPSYVSDGIRIVE